MILYDLAYSFIPLKNNVLIELLSRFNSAETIFNMSHFQLTENNGLSDAAADKLIQNRERCYDRASNDIMLCTDLNIGIISYSSKEYPSLLKECSDAPLILYVLGNKNFSFSSEKWISIIGTRHFSSTGEIMSDKLLKDISLSQPDTVIVNSLSDGVEMLVCKSALRHNLKVVGIIINSLDNWEKEPNRSAIKNIIGSGGTIISEYPLKSTFHKQNYAERNRIVAGISHATVVVEASIASNTLKTAQFAAGYGRYVFAYPGRITDDSFSGNNRLIKNRDAELITEFSDIEYSLGMEHKITPIDIFDHNLSGNQKYIYEILKDGEEHSDEEIMSKTGLNIIDFNVAISFLTIVNDFVKELPGRIYRKKL